MIDEIDRQILLFVQDDLPLESRPYAMLSEKLGISEDEICARLRKFSKGGLIRRFGAIIRHAKAGYSANAMVVWRIDESDLDKAAAILTESDSVSHLYARQPSADWQFNLYSMIHARDDSELTSIIKSLAGKVGSLCDEYRILKTIREFIKSSMMYFKED
ncbi:MAG TPA: Lrp/AsnC family transcriptional regulator [Firmicutes bacterium]|nr:Lrp/AsnC family transcriptional regulator [Bacillota bacterium]